MTKEQTKVDVYYRTMPVEQQAGLGQVEGAEGFLFTEHPMPVGTPLSVSPAGRPDPLIPAQVNAVVEQRKSRRDRQAEDSGMQLSFVSDGQDLLELLDAGGAEVELEAEPAEVELEAGEPEVELEAGEPEVELEAGEPAEGLAPEVLELTADEAVDDGTPIGPVSTGDFQLPESVAQAIAEDDARKAAEGGEVVELEADEAQSSTTTEVTTEDFEIPPGIVKAADQAPAGKKARGKKKRRKKKK